MLQGRKIRPRRFSNTYAYVLAYTDNEASIYGACGIFYGPCSMKFSYPSVRNFNSNRPIIDRLRSAKGVVVKYTVNATNNKINGTCNIF